MSQRGRFGKYGEVKRKTNLRRSRMLKAGQRVVPVPGDASRPASRRKARNKGSSRISVKGTW